MAVVLSATEQKVILEGVSWETYTRLLAEHQESSGTHFTYDQGALEIMVLSFEHESLKRTLDLLVELLAAEMEIDVEGAGSTTFRRQDLGKGFEPDACFYFQHAEAVRGKKQINLDEDPPPDLVIEIDITSPSVKKLPIFSAVGVPEVWRYTNEGLSILKLEGNAYGEQAHSSLLPQVTGSVLNEFVQSSQKLKRNVWMRQVREWARACIDGRER